jgi:hypothetical protein
MTTVDRPIRLGPAVPRADQGYRAQPPFYRVADGHAAAHSEPIASDGGSVAVSGPPNAPSAPTASHCVGCGLPMQPSGCGHPSRCYMLVPGAAYGAGAQGSLRENTSRIE